MQKQEFDQSNAPFTHPGMVFSRATDQVSADLNGDIAILNLRTKNYFGVAGVGAFIWQKLETPTDFASLTQAVVDEFDVERGQCSTEVSKFLQELNASGLLNTHQRGY